MSKRLGYALAAVGAWLLIVAAVAPTASALAAADAFSFKDTFSSGAYNGNDGSLAYNGPWWEENDWGGSNKGAVSVVDDDNCPSGPCARIIGESEMWGTGLARRANIEEAASATLHFKYRLVVNEPSAGRLDVVVSDGWNWTKLDSLSLSGADDRVHTASYNVSGYANSFFSIGFFAKGEWHGAAYIDDVKVSGLWGETVVITEPPTTSTTTTTTEPPPTTTTAPPTTTTTTTSPPSTTAGPTTTSRPPSATTTPPTRPTTPPTVPPPTATTPPTTTRPPSTEEPLTNDQRYHDKGAFTFFVFDDELTTATAELATMPGGEDTLPRPGPVTQIMASITVTAVTIRSHLLSAIALGLLIAAAAVVGLGRRENSS